MAELHNISKLPRINSKYTRAHVKVTSSEMEKRSYFYSKVSVWDVLVDCSDVATNTLEDGNNLEERRLASIIYNLDKLLENFKKLVKSVCPEIPENSGYQVHDFIEGQAHLTTDLTKMFQRNSPELFITNPTCIKNEFEKCSIVVDSMLHPISIPTTIDIGGCRPLSDCTKQTEHNLNDIAAVNNKDLLIKQETTDNLQLMHGLNIYEAETKNSFNDIVEELHNFSTCDDDGLGCESNYLKHGSTNQKEPSRDNKHSARRRYRALGYYTDFIISEDVYNQIISQGAPYTCTLCEKEYKIRRCFEHHLAGIGWKCPQMPIEKPKYSLTNNVYRCTFPDCNHKLAKIGTSQIRSIWLHHEKRHLTANAKLPYKCNKCERTFLLHSFLSSHMTSAHTDKMSDTSRNICDICGKVFIGSYQALKKHMLVHSIEKKI